MLQTSELQPPPVSSQADSLHKKEVCALKEQLDKLLGDLEAKSHELRTSSTAHADMKHLLQQASESHCTAERQLSAQIATLRSDLELTTQELRAESQAHAEAELALQSFASVQGQGIADGQLAAALRRDLDASNASLQVVKADLEANQQVLARKQQEVELLQQELAAKVSQLKRKQAAARSYGELEEVLSQASEEQSTSEDKLMAQLNALQDEVKVMHLGASCLLLFCSKALSVFSLVCIS